MSDGSAMWRGEGETGESVFCLVSMVWSGRMWRLASVLEVVMLILVVSGGEGLCVSERFDWFSSDMDIGSVHVETGRVRYGDG